jgi:hypothetical protein
MPCHNCSTDLNRDLGLNLPVLQSTAGLLQGRAEFTKRSRSGLGEDPHPARLRRPIQSRLNACVARSGDARPDSRAMAS